jgi:hypothetical protein
METKAAALMDELATPIAVKLQQEFPKKKSNNLQKSKCGGLISENRHIYGAPGGLEPPTC